MAATPSLKALSYRDLYQQAQAVDLEGRSGMSKAQLFRALKRDDALPCAKQNHGAESLAGIVQNLKDEATGKSMSVAEVRDALSGGRVFGALIVVFAILMLIPIPLWPVVFAALTGLLGAQLLIGRDHPWLPQRLLAWDIPSEKLCRTLDWVAPKVAWVDRITTRRLPVLTGPTAARVGGVGVVLLSAMMIPMSLLPLVDFVFVSGLVLLGGSLLLRDGLLVVMGGLVTAGLVMLLPWMMGQLTTVLT